MHKNKCYIRLEALVLMVGLAFGIPALKNIADVTFAQDVSQEVQTIKRLIKDGKDDLAIKSAKEYLISDPNDVNIGNILAEAYINKSDLDSAETVLKRTIAIQPGDPWSSRLLARIYRIKSEGDPTLKSSNLALALKQVKIGLGSNPNDIWLLGEASQIYLKQGNKTEAIQTIDRALKIAPKEEYLIKIKEMINTEIVKPI